MSGSIKRLNERLKQRAQSKGLNAAQHVPVSDFTVQLIAAHCDEFLYLRISPPTANGVIRMTRDQFGAQLEEGVKVLASFDARQDAIKAAKK